MFVYICDSKQGTGNTATLGGPHLMSDEVFKGDNLWKIQNLTKFCKDNLRKFAKFYYYVLVNILKYRNFINDCRQVWNCGPLEATTSVPTNTTIPLL
jgi:hypothetical protein